MPMFGTQFIYQVLQVLLDPFLSGSMNFALLRK